jgi:hypothetical protein
VVTCVGTRPVSGETLNMVKVVLVLCGVRKQRRHVEPTFYIYLSLYTVRPIRRHRNPTPTETTAS